MQDEYESRYFWNWWDDITKNIMQKITQQAEDEFARTHDILKEAWERDKKQRESGEPQYFQGFRKLINPQDEKEQTP